MGLGDCRRKGGHPGHRGEILKCMAGWAGRRGVPVHGRVGRTPGCASSVRVTWPALPASRPEPAKAERPHSKHTRNFFPVSQVKAEEQTLVALRAPGPLLLHCRKPLTSLAEGRARPGWARGGGSLPHINSQSWAPVDPWGPQRASEAGKVPSLLYRGDNFSRGPAHGESTSSGRGGQQ